VKDKRRTVPIL